MPHLSKTGALLLSLLILAGSSRELLLWSAYEIWQGEIEARFCINKARPEKHCHGKCHLMKALKEEKPSEEQPRPLPKPPSERQINWLHLLATFAFRQMQMQPQKRENIPYIPPHSRAYLPDIFHPPQKMLAAYATSWKMSP